MKTALGIPIPVYQTTVSADQLQNAWEEQKAHGKHPPAKVGCVDVWIMMNAPRTVVALEENVKVC